MELEAVLVIALTISFSGWFLISSFTTIFSPDIRDFRIASACGIIFGAMLLIITPSNIEYTIPKDVQTLRSQSQLVIIADDISRTSSDVKLYNTFDSTKVRIGVKKSIYGTELSRIIFIENYD